MLSTVIALTCASAPTARATQIGHAKKFGIGGMVGSPTGFTLKWLFHPMHGLAAGLGVGFFDSAAFHSHVDYHFQPTLLKAEHFHMALTVGAGVKFFVWFSRNGCVNWWGRGCGGNPNADDDIAGVGIRFPVGLTWMLIKIPLEAFFEFAVGPGFTFGGVVGAFVDGYVGARYYF